LKYARQLIISLCSSHNSPTLLQKTAFEMSKIIAFMRLRISR
jgi:hypothetical protein